MLPYNDLAAVEAAFAAHEPDRRDHHRGGAGQHGRGRAAARLQRRRWPRSPTAHGALLIIDEVMTGFRVSRGGWQGLEPVDADLFTFGKVMGGGLPAAAFGGRAEIMSQLAPAGPVYQAGTLSGNPLACAAGLATLRLADDAIYAGWTRPPRPIGELATEALADAGRAAPAGDRRQHVLDLLHRRRGHRLRRRRSSRTSAAFRAFFHSMLGAGRLPAAERVRGVVRLGRDRRRGAASSIAGGAAARGTARPRRRST